MGCYNKDSRTYDRGTTLRESGGSRSITYGGKTFDISGSDKLGIPNNVVSEKTFLGWLGLESEVSTYSIDKYGGANRTRMTQRQRDKLDKELDEKQKEHSEKRQDAIKAYNKFVSNGTIIKPTLLQSALRTANGHSDNANVQAARRVADKMGYDWKTGRKK